MIETRGMAISVEVADAMLKAADVHLVNQETVDVILVTVLVEGDISAVQQALEAGTRLAQERGALIAHSVIPRPEESTSQLSRIKMKNWLGQR